MFYVDLVGKRMGGSARVRDIKKFGLLRASQMREEEGEDEQ